MRIALIGDTHGSVPALEAALAGCRGAGANVIVHCGDFLSTPFSPDPPGETIAVLRREGVRVVLGNGEVYLRDWGTPRWERTLAQRRRRPDPLNDFLPSMAAGQAELSAEDLAWLRAAPEELTLDVARPGDVYVCHAMPGDPFSTPWDTDPRYTPAFTTDELNAALSRPDVASADLILCGHVPGPLVQRTSLPNGRWALVVRGTHFGAGMGDTAWIDYLVLEPVGPVAAGYAAWEISRRLASYRPRDPTWTWDKPWRRIPAR